MKFHDVHGANVALSESKKIARRTASFCDAFVFSEVPLKLNSATAIELTSSDDEWVGACFIGITSKNPASFIESAYSKHLINLMTNGDDVWIRQIPAAWSGAHLTIHLTFDGQLEITTEYDSTLKYVFLENLPVNFPLWLVIDLYGSTSSVHFPSYSSPNSREIVSLGSDVFTTYKSGEEGVVPYNSARLALIGPKQSGKSQLKHVFTNSFNLDAKEDESVETSTYTLSTNDGAEWTILANHSASRVLLNERTKTELYQEMAQNIVHEIIITNKGQLDNPAVLSSKDLIKNVLKFPRKLRRSSYSKEVKQLSENLNEIPEELMLLIEECLKSLPNDDAARKNDGSSANKTASLGQRYVLSVTDFSGSLLYLIVNQFFFTSCAVYLFVFNLTEDLDSKLNINEDLNFISEFGNQPTTLLNSLHLWISLIHTTIASFQIPNEEDETATSTTTTGDPDQEPNKQLQYDLQPQVVLVGTHRNSIHAEPITRNQIVKEIFEKIFASFSDKCYSQHLCKTYIALDSKEMSFDEPNLVQKLRQLVESLIVDKKITGFNVPISWIQLEQILEKFKQRGIYFVDINQLHTSVSSQVDSFQSYDNLNAALHFYHNQGKLFYLDCISQLTSNERQNPYDLGLIILDPNWFVNCIYKLCSYVCTTKNDDDNLSLGVISENIINSAWSEFTDQKFLLLGCLENLDIICELNPYIQLEDTPDVAATSTVPKLYFFPWITKPAPEAEYTHNHENFGESTFQFVISFNLLPVSLFTRLLIRLSKWSWNQGWGRKPEMFNSKGRIAVDFDHDIILKINLFQGRIYLIIVKIFEELQNDQIENLFIGPAANVCVKVQHLIESELESLKNTYYRRLSFKLVIPCPCDVTCGPHRVEGCSDEKCLHFLSLQECLKKKVVECKFNRQVRTSFIQRFLPYAPTSNNEMMYDTMYSPNPNEVWDNVFQVEPLWMREAAKLLSNNNQASNDWISLAKRLSYSERDVTKFSEEISPSLALLKDWYESNGRTRYCIDVLVSCLRMLSRDDIASLIEYELEPESSSPPIFLSYQHDSQKQVLEIRRKLELSGFPCWMDTSSLGGGDALYGKIYEGISRAKVFVCCLTPRYVASPMCNREVTLADVLHKPILPLIIEFTPWPPPGAMALIMSSIVYIDLCGVGSHSGIGRLQDTESRFREILDHVSRYISGYSDMPVVSSRYLQLPDLFNSRRSQQTGTGSQKASGSVMRQTRRQSEARSLSPPIESEHERVAADRARADSQLREVELPFSDEIISDDNISVISRSRIANRVSNCSVCRLM